MKTLLLMADDGVSSLVWLEMARQYLGADRPVFAITEDSNVDQVVGLGDDAPGYGNGLRGHPDFQAFAVNKAGAAEVLDALKQLKRNVVVMFNMDPFSLVEAHPAWQSVLDHCNTMDNELVATHAYAHPEWQHLLNKMLDSEDGSAVRALQSVSWDYVAGYRAVTAKNLKGLRRCFSSLANVIELPLAPRVHLAPDVFTWQIINPSGTYELRLPYSQFQGKPDAYPALWNVHYPLVSPDLDWPDCRSFATAALSVMKFA